MKYQVAILMVFFAAAAIIANLYILKIFIATKFSETQIDIKLPFMGQEGIEILEFTQKKFFDFFH